MRKPVLRFLVWLALLILVVGCRTSANSRFSKGIIKNNSTNDISDVSILYLPTRKTIGFSDILANQEAILGIAPRELLADQALLSWTEMDNSYEVLFSLRRYQVNQTGRLNIMVFEIYANGQAQINVTQEY